MIKDIERFLYSVVKAKLLDDNKLYIGYFVKAQRYNKRYEILPLDIRDNRLEFCKSYIEKMEFYR